MTAYISDVAMLRAVAAALLLLPGAGSAEGPFPPTVLIGVDMSVSVGPGQREAWLPSAIRVADALQPGQLVLLFPVDGQTANSRPIFRETLPLPPRRGAGIGVLAAFKREWRTRHDRIMRGLRASLEEQGKAQQTDILGLIERARSRPERPISIVIFSDAINSTSELELAQRFSSADRLAQRVSAFRKWDGAALKGIELSFILTSTNPSPNARSLLRAFWDRLATSLGGHLRRFDTDWE